MTRILVNRGKDKKITVKEIVIEKLRELCADGLCYDDECGCGLGNFMPCEGGLADCVPVKISIDKYGEEIFVPMEEEK